MGHFRHRALSVVDSIGGCNTLCFEQSEAGCIEAKASEPVGELLLSALIEAHVIRFVRALPTLGVARLIARATCLRRTRPRALHDIRLGKPCSSRVPRSCVEVPYPASLRCLSRHLTIEPTAFLLFLRLRYGQRSIHYLLCVRRSFVLSASTATY